MAKCQNCGKKRKLSVWVGNGGVLAWAHGNYVMWCDRCIAEAQLKNAKENAKRIPELEKKLKKLK